MSARKEWAQSLGVARRFLPELTAHRRRLVAVSAVSLVWVGLDLLRPWPMQWIFDRALAPTEKVAPVSWSVSTIVWTGVAAALVIAAANALLQYVREVSLAEIEFQVTRGLRHRIFAHLSTLSPRFHARNKSGDLLVRLMGDVPMVSTMIVNSFVEITTRAVFVVGTVLVMTFLDPLLTLVVFTVAPLVALTVKVVSRRARIAVRKQRRKEGALADYLHEAIAATETIQSLGSADHVVRRFARSNRTTSRAGLKATRLGARLSGSVESLLGVATACVLALGSWRVLDGDLTAGQLLVFLSYVRTLLKPVRSASKHAIRIAKGTACGERILSILETPPEVASAPGAVSPPTSPTTLVFEDVHFRYDKGELALQGFSATFRRGGLSALVGRSGAGKSTAAALAARLFDPDEGRITLDGAPLVAFDLALLRARVGLCLQRTTLFGDSIRENLLLGRPDARDEELWCVLEDAGAAQFVRSLPGGLDTQLGSGGVGLSGGQRSRLALARTLLRETAVLIIDEPFAGLDRLATERVAQTLAALARDRIVIVIAHDIERLDHYDHIVLIEHGRAAGAGCHAQLLAEIPLYRSVIRSLDGKGA